MRRSVSVLSWGAALAILATSGAAWATSDGDPPAASHTHSMEVVASLGTLLPSHSPFRSASVALGYDDEGVINAYEAEATVQLPVAWRDRISIGPIARYQYDRLHARYGGLDPIANDSAWLGAREEAVVYDWPRFFVWADQTLGIASIGPSGSRTTIGAWGVRGGIGVRVFSDTIGARFRLGFAYAPSMARVTDPTGGYDYGGFMFAIDGVLRVGR